MVASSCLVSWIRKVSARGQVSLGSQRYGLGKAWAGQTVSIRFDPEQRQFVFTHVKPKTKGRKPQPELPPARLDAKGLTVEEIRVACNAGGFACAATNVAVVNVLSPARHVGGMTL